MKRKRNHPQRFSQRKRILLCSSEDESQPSSESEPETESESKLEPETLSESKSKLEPEETLQSRSSGAAPCGTETQEPEARCAGASARAARAARAARVSESDSDSEETLSDSDSDTNTRKIIRSLFGCDDKINRSEENHLDELITDWREGFANKAEAEEYRDTLERYVAHYNSVPTIGEIMKIPVIADEIRRELIDLRLCLDTPGIEKDEWRKKRNLLKLRVDYYYGRIPPDSTEAHEVKTSGGNLKEIIQNNRDISETRRRKLLELYREMTSITDGSAEAAKLEKKIQCVLSLRDNIPPPTIDNPIEVLQTFRTKVDKDLYGLRKPKEELMCFLNGYITGGIPGCVIGLESPPGMGKTSLALAVAEAMGCGWYKIPVGSLTDSSQLTGNQTVYTGSTSGLIVEALKRFTTSAGVIIFDEIDKIPAESRQTTGLVSALIELLDFSQNHEFTDAQLEVPLDLSKTIMIVTMNDRTDVNPIVLNRIQTIIKLKPYSYKDRFTILEDIMVPKYLKKYQLESCINFTKKALRAILELAPPSDKGMRPQENTLKTVLSRVKLYRTCVMGQDTTLVDFVLPEFSPDMYTITETVVRKLTQHLQPETDSLMLQMMYQ